MGVFKNLDIDRQDNIRSEVYNALADIMFTYDGTKEDMDAAIEWFNKKFYEDDDCE